MDEPRLFGRLLEAGSARGRLLSTGLPLLLTSATMVVIPVIARQYLDDTEYAGWALLLTVVTAAGLLDLGGVAYLQALGYGRRATGRQYAHALGLTTAGAAAVTGLALLAGPLITATDAAASLQADFVPLVALCGMSAAVRSAAMLMLARLQVSLRFRLRARVAVLLASAQVAGCWIALAVGAGLWSLGLGVLAGSLLALAVGHVALVLRPETAPTVDVHTPLGRFATFRTLSTLVAVAGSQADRWVLALVAAPAFLADYDLAMRFAQLPLGVVGALLVGITSEAAALPGNAERRGLVRRTSRQAAVLMLVLALGTALLVLLLGGLGLLPVDQQLVVLFALALLWSGAVAVTAPTTFASIGVGHPERELFYAVPALACTVVGWVFAVTLQEPWLVPLSTTVSVTSWSLWFVRYGIRRARY